MKICICCNSNINKSQYISLKKNFEEIRDKSKVLLRKEILDVSNFPDFPVFDIKEKYSQRNLKCERNLMLFPSEKMFRGYTTNIINKEKKKKNREVMQKEFNALLKHLSPKYKLNLGIEFEKDEKDIKLNELQNKRNLQYLEILNKNNIESNGFFCLWEDIEKEDLQIFNSIKFPIEIPLGEIIKKEIGNINISGFELSFHESPIGIEKVKISFDIEEKKYSLFFKVIYKSKKPSDLFKKIYDVINSAKKILILDGEKGGK